MFEHKRFFARGEKLVEKIILDGELLAPRLEWKSFFVNFGRGKALENLQKRLGTEDGKGAQIKGFDRLSLTSQNLF